MTCHRYWISYDISDDARRSNLSQLLSRFGVRIQFSVFESVLSDAELRKLLRESARYINLDEDSLLIYQCAAVGQPGHHLLGVASDERKDFWVA